MFDVTTFLIRWFFLSNLARDAADLQSIPCQPYFPPPPHHSPTPIPRHAIEQLWRDDCLRGILSHPPGLQRALVLEAVRVDLVHQLARTLRHSSHVLKARRRMTSQSTTSNPSSPSSTDASSSEVDDGIGDPFRDADVEILRAFGKDGSTPADSRQQATLLLSSDEAPVLESASSSSSPQSSASRLRPHDGAATPPPPPPPPPSHEEVQRASRHLQDAKEYLPQLVGAVLRAPSPLVDDPLNVLSSDPVRHLRDALLRQCADDPGFGVDLCWLLEAEVGRAWKTLFEHRQQTGRRLVVVLPAEKAAVLAQIGSEKRGAFDWLQDAEQATAYGVAPQPQQPPPPRQVLSADGVEEDSEDYSAPCPRLPSSLSLRRCSHFGDTMHFVDRLTRISLELRSVPISQRLTFLHESLHEMNRRIRRRMVSRGDISFDVEDHRGPHDWPQIQDLTADMLHSSVHFPLVPQTGVWPDGRPGSTPPGDVFSSSSSSSDVPPVEVVRVLNIVVPESRLLASRERCPFLVHLEVADTSLEASDARLYAWGGASHLGSTLEEALGMSSAAAGAAAATTARRQSWSSPAPFGIPEELLRTQQAAALPTDAATDLTPRHILAPRGGSQSDEVFLGDTDYGGWMYGNSNDMVRQQQYEELHLQLLQQQYQASTLVTSVDRPAVSTGMELLDKVFGQPWLSKCQEIRNSSPFGHIEGWRLASFIMKAGEDIRREALVMQVISKLRTWFKEIPEQHRPFMRPYTIMTVGGDAGMIECLSDAKSVDEVKKKADGFTSLRDYFERAYGPPNSVAQGAMPSSPHPLTFEQAQDNFLRSLVGYSLVCYILQIKDRHNANILLDREGHIMHIDFGFVLGDTPKMGKVPIFSERAPFKLSNEFWEVLGGWNVKSGGLGVRFCKMFELAFACASAHADEIATLVEGIMELLTSNASTARAIANGVRSRLRMRGRPGSLEQQSFVVDLVNAALTSWGTSTYDWLQRSMNGYQ